jgi:cardiolipin synthase
MLRYLPNSLTILRLLLAIPLGLLILQQDFLWALGVGVLAGVTDALDGFAARRLNAFSRLGAALDPIADKVLITVSFLCSAQVGLIPWTVAVTIISRDLVIVSGALCYHYLVGPFEFGATTLSKVNMIVQITFCVLVLLAQVVPDIPQVAITVGTIAVLVIAIASGMDYVDTAGGHYRWHHRGAGNRHCQRHGLRGDLGTQSHATTRQGRLNQCPVRARKFMS